MLVNDFDAVRKNVSVVFCDLVGSTELGERLDAESFRKVAARYFEEMRSVIDYHEGSVEKFIGDAVVAVFGIPILHEDDAMRAVRAAWGMRQRLGDLNVELERERGVSLSCRIGVNTGEVLTGDRSRSQTLAGDTMNTAARLEQTAEPGEILIGSATAQLVRELVELAPVAPLELKGKAGVINAFRLQSLSERRHGPQTTFIGRGRPLETLIGAFDEAVTEGACVLVTVLGVPGIGKSRLAEELTTVCRSRSATVLIGRTPAYGDGVTFAPVLDVLQQASGVPSIDPKAVVEALRNRLASRADGAAIIDRLAELLGVRESPEVGDVAWAVRRLLEYLAAEHPVVLVMEDLHWASESLLDVLDALADRAHGPILLVCLARPELLENRPAWGGGKRRARGITLGPLRDADARAMASQMLGGPDGDALERITRTAEGNPLYLEQLVAMFLERRTSSSDRTLASPSIQAVLAARLERLTSAQWHTIAAASIEGRRFHQAAVRAIDPGVDSDQRAEIFRYLERGGFIVPEDETGETWRFAHPLIHECTYQRLPKETRAQLHEILADWIAEQSARDRAGQEAVGFHLERVVRFHRELGPLDQHGIEVAVRAGTCLAAAGSRAFTRIDMKSAAEFYGRARDLLPEGHAARIEFLPDLGVALTETGRLDEARALLAKAVDESRAAGSELYELCARVQLLSTEVYLAADDQAMKAAVDEATQIRKRLQAIGDDKGLAQVWILTEYLNWALGAGANAGEACIHAMTHARAAGRVREEMQAATDLSGFYFVGPHPVHAMRQMGEQLRASNDPAVSSAGFAVAAGVAALNGDIDQFRRLDGRMVQTLESNGLEWLLASHAYGSGLALLELGEPSLAEARLRRACETMERLGDRWYLAIFSWLIPIALAGQGRTGELIELASALEERAPALDRDTRIRREIVRSKVLLARGEHASAEVAAIQAVSLAAGSDLVLAHAGALEQLAVVIGRDQRRRDAEAVLNQALIIFERKGNRPGAQRVRRSIAGD